MIIGIDASRTTVARRTGTEAYALELTRALLDLQTDHQWRLYFREEPPPDLFKKPAFSPTQLRYGALREKAGFYETRLIAPRRLWTHVGLSRELMRSRPDRLFIPAHVLPLYHPCPSIVTIHDLGYIHFPQSHPLKQRLYLDLSTRYSATFATRLLADSEATRRDLISFYNTPPEKITVVYPGYDESLKPVRHPNQKAIVAEKYKLPQKFLLHVGTIQPRKNLETLFDAYDPTQIALVCAGRRGSLSDSIYEKGKAQGVMFLDYVDDADLAALYSMAAAYVAPSLYEGFGFPVLEAMACGTPVICSDGGSLPEVGGDAAIVIAARDTQKFAEAIRRVIQDEHLRRELIIKGYRNLNRFSWERAAEQTLKTLIADGG